MLIVPLKHVTSLQWNHNLSVYICSAAAFTVLLVLSTPCSDQNDLLREISSSIEIHHGYVIDGTHEFHTIQFLQSVLRVTMTSICVYLRLLNWWHFNHCWVQFDPLDHKSYSFFFWHIQCHALSQPVVEFLPVSRAGEG